MQEFLLDTHVWLWSLLAPDRLRKRTRTALVADGVSLWLSPISVWETSLLVERGRLDVDDEPRRWIRSAIQHSGVGEVALNHEVALQSREVELAHSDPADRFLAATASVYGLTLLTADERLLSGNGYTVRRA